MNPPVFSRFEGASMVEELCQGGQEVNSGCLLHRQPHEKTKKIDKDRRRVFEWLPLDFQDHLKNG